MVAKLDGTNGLLQQYDYQAPTTGFSYTFAAGVNVLVMNPAGTLATGTITMPASPADGMTISFSSTQTITALTVNANTGQSIVRKPTSFGAGSAMTFVYRLSNTTWYPMTNYATAGTVLQVVNVQTGTVATGTGIIPFDNTIPQITEGNEYMTLAITPTSATSLLIISVVFYNSNTPQDEMTVALFQDSTANALAAVSATPFTPTARQVICFTHKMTSGTTSATTFRIRAGMASAGTTTFNGQSGAQRFGGVAASSITIYEVAV